MLTYTARQVNSQNYGCAIPQESWPYQVSGLASMPSIFNHTGNALDPFTMNNTNFITSLCPSSYPGTSPLARTQPPANSSSLYQLMPNRADSCTSLSSFPLDSYFDPLSMSNGPYMLPGHTSQASSAWYGASSDSLRQWSSSGRPSIGYDPDLPARYLSSNTSYGETVLTPGSSSIEPASGFPTMRALANSLPLPNSLRNSDRVLPNPRGSLGLPLSETAVGNHGLMTDLPSTIPWGPERVIAGRSQTPVSTGSSSLGAFSMTATDGKRSATPPDNQQTAFGYLEHSPQTGCTTPIADFSGTKSNVASGTGNMTSATMQNHLLSSSTYDSGLSSDTILRRDGSATNLYTYSTSSGSKEPSRSSDGDGKLLNGQTYMPFRQLQQQKAMAYDARHCESNETSTHLTHRPSIASVGSSR